jgi:plasmid maintenance system killer protein
MNVTSMEDKVLERVAALHKRIATIGRGQVLGQRLFSQVTAQRSTLALCLDQLTQQCHTLLFEKEELMECVQDQATKLETRKRYAATLRRKLDHVEAHKAPDDHLAKDSSQTKKLKVDHAKFNENILPFYQSIANLNPPCTDIVILRHESLNNAKDDLMPRFVLLFRRSKGQSKIGTFREQTPICDRLDLAPVRVGPMPEIDAERAIQCHLESHFLGVGPLCNLRQLRTPI